MKTFLEWAKDNHLFNELSPELLGRAANAATRQYDYDPNDRLAGIRSGLLTPGEGEGGRNFKKAAIDRYKFTTIVRNALGNIFSLPITAIHRDGVGEFKVYTDGLGPMYLSVGNGKKMFATEKDGFGQHSVEMASARELTDRLNKLEKDSGSNLVYSWKDLPLFRAASTPSATKGQPAQDMNVPGTAPVPSQFGSGQTV